ncbi:MAG: hypothetical protein AB8B97_06405 [Granulosicoccus sp.]
MQSHANPVAFASVDISTPGWPSDEQSDHLTSALDDEEGNTMQQLLRSLDHVSDSDGAADRAKSADV